MNETQKRKLITLAMVLVLTVVFAFTTDSFFAFNNLSNLLRGAAYLGIIAAGLTLVIIAGGNNLSTGATVGLVAMVVSRFLDAGVPIVLCILIGLVTGALCGLIDGLLITKLRLPDFVATLATNYVFSGVILLVTFRSNGKMITKSLTNAAFLELGSGFGGFHGISYVIIAWIVTVLALQFILYKTKFGTYVYAVGTNPGAVKITGINTGRIKTICYTISGLCCAIASVFLLAYEGAASLKTGEIYTFNAICAAVIGGAVLEGGHGDVVGTFLGCIFMQLIMNAIYKLNLPSEFQTLLVGVAIIVMSVFNTLYTRRARRKLHELGAREERRAA